MQTNAPGRGKLKVTGILYIIFGALGLLLSLALLAGGGLLLAAGAGTVGIALGAVAGILRGYHRAHRRVLFDPGHPRRPQL